VHMVQHVLLGDLAPLCFVAGLTGPVLRPVLALRPVEKLRVLTHPFVALPLWAVDLCVWHVPFLYDAALHHTAVHALELAEAQLEAELVQLGPAGAGFVMHLLVADSPVACDEAETQLRQIARLDLAHLARDQVVVEKLHERGDSRRVDGMPLAVRAR